MAYVRPRGNHLAIVHGARHPQTGRVEQQVLMTLHSKGEALAAMGRTSEAQGRVFRRWMEDRYPEIRFSWEKIDAAIGELKDGLPDLAKSREERAIGGFRDALDGLTRNILAADPQTLDSAREVLHRHRFELEWLSKLIQWRLDCTERAESSAWSRDPFGWRLALTRETLDPALEETLAGHLEDGKLERAEALFRLVVRVYPKDPMGWNYLGQVALRRGELLEALRDFETCESVARRLFPKRIAKRDYWSRIETRPYIRALRNQWVVLNRLERYSDALRTADRLEQECGDDVIAAVFRAATFLNAGEWGLAYDAAIRSVELHPEQSLVAAFAAFENGDPDQAGERFAQAMSTRPRCVGVVLARPTSEPKEPAEIFDHNAGVDLLDTLAPYLKVRPRRTRTFFVGLWNDGGVAATDLPG